MAKLGFFSHSKTDFLHTQSEKAGYKIKQTEWNTCFDWYLEASKRGNDTVTSLEETKERLFENISEFLKVSRVHPVSGSAPPSAIVVQPLNLVRLFETPWTAPCQSPLPFTISQSLLKLMSFESVMPSNHLIHCHPLLLLSSIFPSIRVFSSELALLIKWPNDWSFSFSISPSHEYSGLISCRTDWFDLAVQATLKSLLQLTIQKHQFFCALPSLQSNSHICPWLLESYSFDYTEFCEKSEISAPPSSELPNPEALSLSLPC